MVFVNNFIIKIWLDYHESKFDLVFKNVTNLVTI